MMARKLDFGEKGRAELLDETVFLMDGSLLKSMIEKTGDDAYGIGKDVGVSLAGNVHKTGISGTKLAEFMMDLLTMMGLGEFEIHEFDITEKEGEVRVKNCIISREETDAENCSIVAGILAGIFTQNYDMDFEAEEKGCLLQDDGICRFRVQPS